MAQRRAAAQAPTAGIEIATTCQWLSGQGCHVLSDHQYLYRPPREGWLTWMQQCIDRANVVLVICTPKLKQRYEKSAPVGSGLGATFEGAMVTQRIYADAMHNDRFFPILPDNGSEARVPMALKDWLSGHRFPRDNEKICRMIFGDSSAGIAKLTNGIVQDGSDGAIKQAEALTRLLDRIEQSDTIYEKLPALLPQPSWSAAEPGNAGSKSRFHCFSMECRASDVPEYLAHRFRIESHMWRHGLGQISAENEHDFSPLTIRMARSQGFVPALESAASCSLQQLLKQEDRNVVWVDGSDPREQVRWVLQGFQHIRAAAEDRGLLLVFVPFYVEKHNPLTRRWIRQHLAKLQGEWFTSLPALGLIELEHLTGFLEKQVPPRAA